MHWTNHSPSQSYIRTDGQSVSQSVLVSGTHLRPATTCVLIIIGQLRVFRCKAPSLTRSRVCIFQFLQGNASAAFLRSGPHLLSLFLRLPHLEGQVPVFISPRNRVAQLYPRVLGGQTISKSMSHHDRQSVSQTVLVSGTHLGPATNFYFSLWFSFRQLRFVML
jgi:hypothetical protein